MQLLLLTYFFALREFPAGHGVLQDLKGVHFETQDTFLRPVSLPPEEPDHHSPLVQSLQDLGDLCRAVECRSPSRHFVFSPNSLLADNRTKDNTSLAHNILLIATSTVVDPAQFSQLTSRANARIQLVVVVEADK